jgi:hypothetical protein
MNIVERILGKEEEEYMDGSMFSELLDQEEIADIDYTKIAIRLSETQIVSARQGLSLIPMLSRIISQAPAHTAVVGLRAASRIIRRSKELASEQPQSLDFNGAIQTILTAAENNRDKADNITLTDSQSYFDLKATVLSNSS